MMNDKVFWASLLMSIIFLLGTWYTLKLDKVNGPIHKAVISTALIIQAFQWFCISIYYLTTPIEEAVIAGKTMIQILLITFFAFAACEIIIATEYFGKID